MSVLTNLKVASLAALLLLSFSCSREKNSSRSPAKAPQQNAVCEGIQCLNSIKWKISLQGQDFPDKTRVDINGVTVIDECISKQKFRIDRHAEPEVLVLDNFMVPKGKVRIHVVDKGLDCSTDKTVIHDENVRFDVVKGANGSEIVIQL